MHGYGSAVSILDGFWKVWFMIWGEDCSEYAGLCD